jgi:hypothetical protein
MRGTGIISVSGQSVYGFVVQVDGGVRFKVASGEWDGLEVVPGQVLGAGCRVSPSGSSSWPASPRWTSSAGFISPGHCEALRPVVPRRPDRRPDRYHLQSISRVRTQKSPEGGERGLPYRAVVSAAETISEQ